MLPADRTLQRTKNFCEASYVLFVWRRRILCLWLIHFTWKVLGVFMCSIKTFQDMISSRNLKFEKSYRESVGIKVVYGNITKELDPFGPISVYALGSKDCPKPKIFRPLYALFCSLLSSNIIVIDCSRNWWQTILSTISQELKKKKLCPSDFWDLIRKWVEHRIFMSYLILKNWKPK